MAAYRLFAVLGALSVLSCTELSARWNDHRVFFGTVREVDTEAALTAFCSETFVDHAESVVVSAPPGVLIEEEVFVEGRTEVYWGDTPPERASSFWCSDVPQLYQRPLNTWICLRTVGDDPPATILAVDPRGDIAPDGSSSGYALELQVQHPGILRVMFDAQCLSDHFNIAIDAGSGANTDAESDADAESDPDAGAAPEGDVGSDTDAGSGAGGLGPWNELTIQ